jgi:hypothetical protein
MFLIGLDLSLDYHSTLYINDQLFCYFFSLQLFSSLNKNCTLHFQIQAYL